MYAYVCAATGWTWEYVGECMTLPRLTALYEHWRVYPPVAITAALFAGYKPADPPKKVGTSEAGDELGAWLSGMPVDNQRKPGHD